MKKDDARFTIRFNSVDPSHQKAMAVLHAAGRRKASLIADAVNEYLLRHSDSNYTETLPYTQTPVIVSAHSPINISNASAEYDSSSRAHTQDSAESDIRMKAAVSDDEMRDTILDGLSAFKM